MTEQRHEVAIKNEAAIKGAMSQKQSGSWGMMYVPGDCLALCGGAAVVLVKPVRTLGSHAIAGFWADIEAAATIDELEATLNSWHIASADAALLMRRGDRIDVRLCGAARVLDADSGLVLADGNQNASWENAELELVQLRIDMSAFEDGAPRLPLSAGVAQCAAVVLDPNGLTNADELIDLLGRDLEVLTAEENIGGEENAIESVAEPEAFDEITADSAVDSHKASPISPAIDSGRNWGAASPRVMAELGLEQAEQEIGGAESAEVAEHAEFSSQENIGSEPSRPEPVLPGEATMALMEESTFFGFGKPSEVDGFMYEETELLASGQPVANDGNDSVHGGSSVGGGGPSEEISIDEAEQYSLGLDLPIQPAPKPRTLPTLNTESGKKNGPKKKNEQANGEEMPFGGPLLQPVVLEDDDLLKLKDGESLERQEPTSFEVTAADGRKAVFDGAVVIGRAPRSEDSATLAVASPNHDISRSHLRVGLEGDRLLVTDLRSTNGSIVHMPGQDQAVQLLDGQRVTVPTGTDVDLGDGVVLTFKIVA